MAEPVGVLFGLRTWVGPGNHVLDGVPDPPIGRGNIEEGARHPIVKYRYTLWSSVQKQLNQSRCRVNYHEICLQYEKGAGMLKWCIL